VKKLCFLIYKKLIIFSAFQFNRCDETQSHVQLSTSTLQGGQSPPSDDEESITFFPIWLVSYVWALEELALSIGRHGTFSCGLPMPWHRPYTYEGRRSFGMVALSSPTTPGVMESTKQKCWKLSRKGKQFKTWI